MCDDLDDSGMIDIDGSSFFESEALNASMLSVGSHGLSELQEESSEEEKKMPSSVRICFDIAEGAIQSSLDKEVEKA